MKVVLIKVLSENKETIEGSCNVKFNPCESRKTCGLKKIIVMSKVFFWDYLFFIYCL